MNILYILTFLFSLANSLCVAVGLLTNTCYSHNLITAIVGIAALIYARHTGAVS